MIEIRIRSTGQVVTEREFRAMHDNVVFPFVMAPSVLNEFGADAVLAAPAPTVAENQTYSRNGATQDVKGNWVYAYAVRNLTQEEITTRTAGQVPQQVTMRQARLALLQAGLYATVNNTIANLTGDVGDAARIEWEYSQTVQRRYPLIETLSSLLNLTEEQLDTLFIQAAKL